MVTSLSAEPCRQSRVRIGRLFGRRASSLQDGSVVPADSKAIPEPAGGESREAHRRRERTLERSDTGAGAEELGDQESCKGQGPSESRLR